MTFEDLFLPGFFIGLGLGFSKVFITDFTDWVSRFWKDRKRPEYILCGVLIFLFLLYLEIISKAPSGIFDSNSTQSINVLSPILNFPANLLVQV